MSTDLQQIHVLPRTGRYANPRRGGDVLPIVYGDLIGGGEGGVWTCPCIDTVNFVYAVAAHPVLSPANGNSVTVHSRDGADITANFSFAHDSDYEGLGHIATLTSTAGDQKSNEPLAVRLKGKVDASGNLIQNPMAAVHDFLVYHVGVKAKEFDATWKTRTEDHLASLSIAAAGVVERDVRPDQVITEMLRLMASWWRNGSGKLIFKPHIGPGGVLASDVTAYLGPEQLEGDQWPPPRVVWDEESICTRAAVYFAYNWAKREFEEFDDGSSEAAIDMEARYGKAMFKTFELHWVRSAAVVNQLQEMVVDCYKRPPANLQARIKGFDQLHLEQGDVVAVSLPWLYDEGGQTLSKELYRLTSMRTALEEKGGVDIEALDLGLRMKNYAQGFSEDLGAGDALTIIRTMYRSFSDGVGIGDTLSGVLSGSFLANGDYSADGSIIAQGSGVKQPW